MRPRLQEMQVGERPPSVAALLGEPGLFRYRGGVRRLLGMGPGGGPTARPFGLVPPVGFRYLEHPLRGGLRVASPPATRPPIAQLGPRQEPGQELPPGPVPPRSRPGQAPGDPGRAPAVEAMPAAAPALAVVRPASAPGATPADEGRAAPGSLPESGNASAPMGAVAELAEPACEQPLESLPACEQPLESLPPAAVEASVRPAPTSRRELEALEQRPAPDRVAAALGRTEPRDRPNEASQATVPPDHRRRQPEPSDPVDRPNEAQREAVWGLLERMGVSVPRPLEVPAQAPEESLRPRPPVPARLEREAPPAGADPAPEVAPPRRAARVAEARVARLRRATGELAASEDLPATPAAETPETPRPPRRAAGPVRQTILVKRPPRPAKVPPAFWQRRRLNLSRLWPVR